MHAPRPSRPDSLMMVHPAPASPAAIPCNVVFHAVLNGILYAYAFADGDKLWHSDLEAAVSGGASEANGTVLVAATAPAFAPFITPGTTVFAFRIVGTAAAPIVPAPGGPSASR